MLPAHVSPAPANRAGSEWHSSSFLLGVQPLRPLAAAAVGSAPAGPGQTCARIGKSDQQAKNKTTETKRRREEEKSKTERKSSSPNCSRDLGIRI